MDQGVRIGSRPLPTLFVPLSRPIASRLSFAIASRPGRPTSVATRDYPTQQVQVSDLEEADRLNKMVEVP